MDTGVKQSCARVKTISSSFLENDKKLVLCDFSCYFQSRIANPCFSTDRDIWTTMINTKNFFSKNFVKLINGERNVS